MGIQIESEQDNAEFEASMKLYELSRRLVEIGFVVTSQFEDSDQRIYVCAEISGGSEYMYIHCKWGRSPALLHIEFVFALHDDGTSRYTGFCTSVLHNRIGSAEVIADIARRFWSNGHLLRADKPQKG